MYWISQNDKSYELWKDNEVVGHLHLFSNHAKFTADQSTVILKRTGLLKNRLEIQFPSENSSIQINPNSWFSSKSDFTYKNKKLTLLVRNRPLVEFVILEEGECLLSYRMQISHSGAPILRVNGSEAKDQLLHLLLWYLIEPVFKEHVASNSDLASLAV